MVAPFNASVSPSDGPRVCSRPSLWDMRRRWLGATAGAFSDELNEQKMAIFPTNSQAKGRNWLGVEHFSVKPT